jgi:hypothetical protein
MTLPITDEMRAAIDQHAGDLICLQDQQSHRTFVLLDLDEYRRLVDQRLRRELDVGFAQAERGDVAPWNVEEFLKKARELHQQSSHND